MNEIVSLFVLCYNDFSKPFEFYNDIFWGAKHFHKKCVREHFLTFLYLFIIQTLTKNISQSVNF